ncbi:MAG TPA: hypothetical protein PKK11_07665, partial [Methanothrix sp.]|nr:hypothetical protein [Methanothrix sp.]
GETNDTDYYFYSSGHVYLQQVGNNIYKKYFNGNLIETISDDGNEYTFAYPFPSSDKLVLL